MADYSFIRASFGQGYRNPSINEKYLRKDIGYADKIRFYIGNALELVPQMDITFDLAFIDGDKRRYVDYYEMVLARLSEGGYILSLIHI